MRTRSRPAFRVLEDAIELVELTDLPRMRSS